MRIRPIASSVIANLPSITMRRHLRTNFFKGHKRSLRAKKNILMSLITRGLSTAIGLILVPLSITYLNPTKYGIWITLSSVIGWFSFFDIGLGAGLRNRFAESVANGRHEQAQKFVSTAYALLSLIILGLLLVYIAIYPFIDWNRILNVRTNVVDGGELSALGLIVFACFCLGLVLRLICTLLTADQRPALASAINLIGQVIALSVIYILTKTTVGSLLYLGTALSCMPIFVLLIASCWMFSNKYKAYRPSFAKVDFTTSKDLLNLGFMFLIIQLTGVIVFSTNNIIIAQLFGLVEVTRYAVAFKYFSVLLMGFSIVTLPFWSAFTDAWAKQEIVWIENIVRKLVLLWYLLPVAGGTMLIFSNWVYGVWVGSDIRVSYGMSGLIMMWFIIQAWNGIFCQFLNGLGKIKLQLLLGIASAILNIPLAIYLGKKIGIEGVLIANVTVSLITIAIYPMQYRRLLSGTAYGIFNK
jgi:O-antigen/teichoic acid export membrane protein